MQVKISLKYGIILLIVATQLINCKDNPDAVLPEAFIDTATSFKREIPTYKNGEADVFYQYAKSMRRHLNLDSLEQGFKNLEIRIWYHYSLSSESKLVIIRNEGPDWKAVVYYLKNNWDGVSAETTFSKKIESPHPKSGWTNFLNRLMSLKILTLPDSGSIPKYGNVADGNTYCVEIATQKQYRFYSYQEPQAYADQLWQAKNILHILKFLEVELGVKWKSTAHNMGFAQAGADE